MKTLPMPKLTKPQSKKLKLIDEINSLAAEINMILNSKRKERYFEGIAIIHSFIEDLLKWLVFTQIVWNKSHEPDGVMEPGEVEQIRGYCNQLNFYALLNIGLTVDLLDFKLFDNLNSIRVERNSLVHQYWLYIHKGKRQIFRKKLEKLAGAANGLVQCFNRLAEEIGVGLDDSFFEISTGRNFVVP
jgi:hypothetical protein